MEGTVRPRRKQKASRRRANRAGLAVLQASCCGGLACSCWLAAVLHLACKLVGRRRTSAGCYARRGRGLQCDGQNAFECAAVLSVSRACHHHAHADTFTMRHCFLAWPEVACQHTTQPELCRCGVLGASQAAPVARAATNEHYAKSAAVYRRRLCLSTARSECRTGSWAADPEGMMPAAAGAAKTAVLQLRNQSSGLQNRLHRSPD